MKKVLFGAALAALAFSACTEEQKQVEDTRNKVRVAVIAEEEVSKDLSYSANLEAKEVVNVNPILQGSHIKKLYVEVGDKVVKGQKLLELDATNLMQTKIQLANMETEYQRALTLKETQSISQQAFDQIETQYNVLKTQIAQLVENTTMQSAISGYVTARNQDEGELYMGTPIYTIEQIDVMKAKINMAEQYYTYVKKGMKVQMTCEVYPNRVFEGVVTIVYPSVDSRSRTFQLEIEFRNGDEALRPGMYGTINFVLAKEKHLVVPSIAVLKVQGSNDRYVFVERDGKSVRIGVNILKRFEDKVAIAPYEGLEIKSSDKLVVVGQANCVDGGEIIVVE